MLFWTGSFSLVAALCWTAPAADVSVAFLQSVCRQADGSAVARVEAYVPHEGDIVLYEDPSLFWRIIYLFAGTKPPDHCGIVVLLPNGTPVLLEAGPDREVQVYLLDIGSRLSSYHKGIVRIRRVKRTLTPAESARMTEFALEQAGKRFAVGRMILQGTPFRSRGMIRSKLFGKTNLNRRRWFCSELVVAAGTVGGLFDPLVHKANTIYPRDLSDNSAYDLSANWEDAAVWSATFPAPASRAP